MNLDPKIASAFRASVLPFPYIAALTAPPIDDEYCEHTVVSGKALTISQRAHDLHLGRKVPRRKSGLRPLCQAPDNDISELLLRAQVRGAPVRVDELVRPRGERHRPRHRLAVERRIQKDGIGQERGYYR
jgi:hypothetical protein